MCLLTCMCVDIVICAFVCIHTVHVRVNNCTLLFFVPPLDGNLASVWVDEESRESAVLVLVSSMDLPSIQLYTNLISDVQMQDDAVGGVVIILVSVLSDGACSYLVKDMHIGSWSKSNTWSCLSTRTTSFISFQDVLQIITATFK